LYPHKVDDAGAEVKNPSRVTVGRMLRVCGIVGLLSVVPAAVAAAEPAPAQPSGPTIRVFGQATVAAKPDQAEIEVGVTTGKKTATAAVSETEHKMEQVLAALKKEVGTNGEIKTSEISVQTRFAETRGGDETSRIIGYTATNMVQVRISDTHAVGRLLDAALKAGANTVERVRFTLKAPDAVQNEALRAASGKARARATAIAEGQGLRVGDVVSVSEGTVVDNADREKSGFEGLRGNVSNANMAATIQPGSIQVEATVTVVFALKR